VLFPLLLRRLPHSSRWVECHQVRQSGPDGFPSGRSSPIRVFYEDGKELAAFAKEKLKQAA